MKHNPAEYWDERFQTEGKIWGEKPSSTAIYALELFKREGIKSLLVPGSGYGRNTKLFSTSGFTVTGIEISQSAAEMAERHDPTARVLRGSVLDIPLDAEIYDGIYCFNVLHLFRRSERIRFLNKCKKQLTGEGMAFFTVFSEVEPSFGKGKEIEENTFESKPGRPVHYFTEPDLLEHFADWETIETGLIDDEENHGDGPHVHVLRYIAIRKACCGREGLRDGQSTGKSGGAP